MAFVVQGAVGCEAVSARAMASVDAPVLSDHCLEMMDMSDGAAQGDRGATVPPVDGPNGGTADHHDCHQFCHPPIIAVAGAAIAAPLGLREATPVRILAQLVGDNTAPATPPPRMS